MSTGRDTLADVLAAVDDWGTAHEPVTAGEIAEELGCTRRSASAKLDELRDRGELRSKAVGARRRVWWRPADADAPDEDSSDSDVRAERDRLNAELRKLLDRIDDGVVALDEEFRITYLNDRAEDVLDVSQRDAVGTDVRDTTFVTETDETAFRRAMNNREKITYEEYSESVDGWTETHVYPSADGAFVYVRDITDRKEREQELERYERLSENLPVGVYRNTPGPDGEFVEINDAMVSIFDADSEAELLEHSVSDLYPNPEERADFSQRLERAGSVEDVELKQETLDGEQIWISVTAVRTEEDGETFFDGIVKDITERKQTEQQLEEERDMFAEGPAIVFRWKPEEGWPVEYVSENVEDVLGYTPAELESGDVPYTDLLLDEEIDRIASEVEQNSDGTTERFSHEPYRVETKGGDVRWVKDTTKVVRDDTGDITHYLGYLVDITDRKEREQELQRQERRFEAIFEDPNILVGLLDPDGTVLDINQTAMEYIDADLEEVTGEPFWETPWWGEGDDVRADVRQWVERAASGEYVDFEADLTRPDGQEYTLNGVFRPVTNEEGDVVSVIVSDRDITERKERERALEQSEQRYRTLAEAFPNGVVTLFDEDLQYTLAAGQAFEELPVSRDDVEGRTVREAWGDDVADRLEPVCRAALDGERNSTEVSYVGRDWVIYAVPITDETGDVFAGMTMAQDITERKETRRKLETQNERLESFASMLAHELRNPVTIGQIYSQQLPDGADPEAVEYVTEAFDRIEDMIDVMLVLTRGRKAVGESTPIDLADVVQEAWDDIDAPDAALDVELDRTIEADETYVRHMVRNLLENAVEHGSTSSRSATDDAVEHDSTSNRSATDDAVEHGGSDVTVTVGELPSGFYVADDGVGIPPAEREAVFEEGYTTAADGGGTGLGLAFVQKLAEVYEWDITVTESEDGGARFEFRNVA